MERGSAGEVYNIGRPEEVTVAEFARMVVRAANSRSEIRFVPGRPQDPARRCPDATKAERELGWRAAVTLPDGLRETVSWYRSALEASRV